MWMTVVDRVALSRSLSYFCLHLWVAQFTQSTVTGKTKTATVNSSLSACKVNSATSSASVVLRNASALSQLLSELTWRMTVSTATCPHFKIVRIRTSKRKTLSRPIKSWKWTATQRQTSMIVWHRFRAVTRSPSSWTK